MIYSNVTKKIKGFFDYFFGDKFNWFENKIDLYDFGKAEIHAGPLSEGLRREIKRKKKIFKIEKQIEGIEEKK